MGLKSSTIIELLKEEHQKVIDSNDRDYSYFHPSEFHDCVRKLAYKHYGVEGDDNIKPDLQRIFDNGHYMHDRYTQYFTDMGLIYGVWECANPLCAEKYGKDELMGIPKPDSCTECGCSKLHYNEVNVVDKEHCFSGHVDCIFKMSKQFHVVDFKTMNSRMFGQLKGPLEKHVIQITIYLWILDIQTGFLLYENKDTQKIKIYEVEKNSELVNKIKSRAKSLKRILEKKKLPKRPFEKSSKQCKRCPFKKVCWS